MEQIERQEIYCHDCGRYVQFDIDLSMNGNHVLKCPNCGHEHCRVVENGIITGERWDSRNGNTFNISMSSITTSITSSYASYATVTTSSTTSGGWFLWQSWQGA